MAESAVPSPAPDTAHGRQPEGETRQAAAQTNHSNRNYLVTALDLDDTLLRSDRTLSPRTRIALQHWHNAHRHIVIATGRPPRSIGESLPPELHEVPWIAYNGAVISLRGRQIYENLLPTDATRDIIRRILHALPDCTLGVEIDNVLYLNRPIQRSSPYQVADLMQVATRPSAKVLFFHQDFATIQSLLAALPDSARVMLSKKYNLVQILAATADKAEALDFLVQHWGLQMAQVVAFGDDVNDVRMVHASGLGVAVENAVQEVKAVADCVTLPNDEDGVAAVIEKLLPT